MNSSSASTEPNPAAKKRVALVDPHPAVRLFLRTHLEQQRIYEVVAEGRTGSEAVRLTLDRQPDLLILELALPEFGARSVIEELRASRSTTNFLIYTGSHHAVALADVMRAQPHGMVHKEDTLSVLWSAVKVAAGGGRLLTPSFMGIEKSVPGIEGSEQLEGRERAVLQMIAESHTSKSIASRLAMSDKTVENIRAKLCGKLGVHDAAALTRIAVSLGLIG